MGLPYLELSSSKTGLSKPLFSFKCTQPRVVCYSRKYSKTNSLQFLFSMTLLRVQISYLISYFLDLSVPYSSIQVKSLLQEQHQVRCWTFYFITQSYIRLGCFTIGHVAFDHWES